MLKIREEFFNEAKVAELANLIVEAIPKIYVKKNHYLKDYVNIDNDYCSVDFRTFLEMAKTGSFIYITLRDNGKLVGCSTFFITTHLHSINLNVATNNFMFLSEGYNNFSNLQKMFNFTEQLAKFKGADKYEFSCVLQDKTLQKYLTKKRQFKLSEINFIKTL